MNVYISYLWRTIVAFTSTYNHENLKIKNMAIKKTARTIGSVVISNNLIIKSMIELNWYIELKSAIVQSTRRTGYGIRDGIRDGIRVGISGMPIPIPNSKSKNYCKKFNRRFWITVLLLSTYLLYRFENFWNKLFKFVWDCTICTHINLVFA